MSLPQLSSILGRSIADLRPDGIAPSVANYFGTARAGVQADYAAAQKGAGYAIPQAFAQAGGIYNTNQVDDAMVNAARNLDFERGQAMKRLEYQEAEAGLTQYNSLLNLLGAGVGTGLNLAGGFSGTQAQAIGGMSTQSPGWGALGGAASGAAMGAQFGGGYGALIGGVLGGVGGYFGASA